MAKLNFKKPGPRAVMFRVNGPLHQWLLEQAQRTNRPLANLCVHLLEQARKNERRPKRIDGPAIDG